MCKPVSVRCLHQKSENLSELTVSWDELTAERQEGGHAYCIRLESPYSKVEVEKNRGKGHLRRLPAYEDQLTGILRTERTPIEVAIHLFNDEAHSIE